MAGTWTLKVDYDKGGRTLQIADLSPLQPVWVYLCRSFVSTGRVAALLCCCAREYLCGPPPRSIKKSSTSNPRTSVHPTYKHIHTYTPIQPALRVTSPLPHLHQPQPTLNKMSESGVYINEHYSEPMAPQHDFANSFDIEHPEHAVSSYARYVYHPPPLFFHVLTLSPASCTNTPRSNSPTPQTPHGDGRKALPTPPLQYLLPSHNMLRP
jgi:hypothetical protein